MKVAGGKALSVQMVEWKMARSRREQQADLQQAMQSKPAVPPAGTQSVQNGRGASGDGASSPRAGRDGSASSARSFSSDPSPFSRRPTLARDSSAYRELVALAAYYRAERRGFAPGGEVEDWLEAEREVAAFTGPP
jgi:hypothetical protein